VSTTPEGSASAADAARVNALGALADAGAVEFLFGGCAGCGSSPAPKNVHMSVGDA
jgi:hypothetical protein